MRAIGAKVPEDHYEALRWLAYRKHTTISAIVAAYVEMCLNLETELCHFPGPGGVVLTSPEVPEIDPEVQQAFDELTGLERRREILRRIADSTSTRLPEENRPSSDPGQETGEQPSP